MTSTSRLTQSPAQSGYTPTSNGAGAYDAIIVGGGHNGLVAAAYLAGAGQRVCVLERRELVGGACITEELWPGRRVSRASYVVSLLHPKVVKDLELPRFGYQAHPLDPGFATISPEVGPILFEGDPQHTYQSIAKASRRDADVYPEFEAVLERAAAFIRPMLLRPAPSPTSRDPAGVIRVIREVGRLAGMSKRDVETVIRVLTGSVASLLDDWFENDAIKGSWASTGVVGAWAGPMSPGTAYNLLHHCIGEVNGISGAWAHVRGGMGGLSAAIAASATARGATIRTDADVHSIDIEGSRVTGVTLASGEQLRAPVVLSNVHPVTTVFDLVGSAHFPPEVVTDMRRYKTRGGSVKINCVLSEVPRYEGVSEEVNAMLLRSSLALCPSINYLENAWHDAFTGKPAEGPYIEVEVPSSVDETLTDDDTVIMTMFTQYGPYEESGWPEGAREAYARRCFDLLAQYAPNVKDAIIDYEVLAPPDLERIFGLVGGSIFQGEHSLDQMAFMRPTPGLADYATPIGGLYLCGAGTHPGGGVMGAPGHNAAHRVLREVRQRSGWRGRLAGVRRS